MWVGLLPDAISSKADLPTRLPYIRRLPRATRKAVDALGKLPGELRRVFVDDHALGRIDRPAPRRALEHPLRVGIAGLPAGADPARREVDVLGVVLAVDARRERRATCIVVPQPQDASSFTSRSLVPLAAASSQLADHMAQAVDLLLPRDVAAGAAGELDVLLAAHHLPDRFRLGAFWCHM